MAIDSTTLWVDPKSSKSGLKEFNYTSEKLKFTGFFKEDRLLFVIDKTCEIGTQIIKGLKSLTAGEQQLTLCSNRRPHRRNYG